MRLKKDDTVVVLAGNNKGKEGKVVAIRGNKIVVEGVNKRKKHQKNNERKGGGKLVEFEAPIHISNVSYSVDGKPVKLRARLNSEKKKEIYYKTKNNEEKVIRTL